MLEESNVLVNTGVVDLLPYDAVLPHVDVLVSNAVYGGFLYGVINSVPKVLARSSRESPR
jgi:UDP:flavonoid glycosyltransferase YjiC (YdhE family)